MIDFGFGIKLDTVWADDNEILRLWRNDYQIWKHCRQHDLINERQQHNWFEIQAKDQNTRMYGVYVDNEELIGVCGLTTIDWIARKAEFSLYIAPEYQGGGFASKALKTLFNHGFSNLNLNLIWGETFNGHAHKVFEHLGMVTEGVRRDFYFKDGKYLDATLISVRRSEWKFSAPQI